MEVSKMKDEDIGFDVRELKWFLECNNKTFKEFLKWARLKK